MIIKWPVALMLWKECWNCVVPLRAKGHCNHYKSVLSIHL